ncbi:MAG: hypothetical protein JXM75_05315 [Chromatiaceae bacterium]|nr:hypothetical protein [Chromatiaceae bacterium]
MFLNTLFLVLATAIMVPAVLILYGVTRWQSATLALGDELERQRRALSPRTYNPEEIAALPTPVQRFFEAVLVSGQPLVVAAELGQEGRINLGGEQPRWKLLRARQSVVTQAPGFLWDARAPLLPGLAIFAQETLLASGGSFRLALFGLLPIKRIASSERLTEAQRLRFLAESVWYPTRLLPSQGVRWEAMDEESARATLVDGEAQTSLVFSFDANGLVRGVRAEARARLVGKQLVETPWEGRFWEYRQHGGMMIPVQAESAWIENARRIPDWQGRITEIMYKFAP